MIEIGRSLPNLTDPAATSGAAKMLAFKVESLFSSATMPVDGRWINLFNGLEYQGCAMGDMRRDDQTPDMALRRDCVLPMQGFGLRDIHDCKAHRVQRHALTLHVRQNPELIAKSHLFDDFDVAVLSAYPDADRARIQILHAGKRLQEDMMVG